MPVRVLLVTDPPQDIAAWLMERGDTITVFLAAAHFGESDRRRLEEQFNSPQPPPVDAMRLRRARTSPPPA